MRFRGLKCKQIKIKRLFLEGNEFQNKKCALVFNKFNTLFKDIFNWLKLKKNKKKTDFFNTMTPPNKQAISYFMIAWVIIKPCHKQHHFVVFNQLLCYNLILSKTRQSQNLKHLENCVNENSLLHNKKEKMYLWMVFLE